MTSAASMLDAHPRPGQVDTNLLADTIDALFGAARTCRQCADACLHESDPMTECIAANLDAADLTAAAAGVLIRFNELETVVAAIEAAGSAVRHCAEECRHHGSHLRHCTTCAQVCEHTEDLCLQMVTALTRRTGATPVVTGGRATPPSEIALGADVETPAATPPGTDPLSPGATLDAEGGPAEPNEPA